MIFAFCTKRAAKKNKKEYHRGFNAAAGMALRGDDLAELRIAVDLARTTGNGTYFDKGVVDALRAYDHLTHTVE